MVLGTRRSSNCSQLSIARSILFRFVFVITVTLSPFDVSCSIESQVLSWKEMRSASREQRGKKRGRSLFTKTGFRKTQPLFFRPFFFVGKKAKKTPGFRGNKNWHHFRKSPPEAPARRGAEKTFVEKRKTPRGAVKNPRIRFRSSNLKSGL